MKNYSNRVSSVGDRRVQGSVALTLRLGRREVTFGRDACIRRYRVHPLVEFSAGQHAGHLEILFFRRWLLVLSHAAVRTVIA